MFIDEAMYYTETSWGGGGEYGWGWGLGQKPGIVRYTEVCSKLGNICCSISHVEMMFDKSLSHNLQLPFDFNRTSAVLASRFSENRECFSMREILPRMRET